MVRWVKYRDPRTDKVGYIKNNDSELRSKSGSHGDHGNILLTLWKYLTSNERKVEDEINRYLKQKKNRTRTSQVKKTTSQDRFQQKQYRQQQSTIKQNNKIYDGGQSPEVVVTGKRPTKMSTSNNAKRRRTPVRTASREQELPLLNNPNYIDNSGIKFIPSNWDGYDDIAGRRQSQQIIDNAALENAAAKARAMQILQSGIFDTPTVTNADAPQYDEYAAPDEYNRGKIGYWL